MVNPIYLGVGIGGFVLFETPFYVAKIRGRKELTKITSLRTTGEKVAFYALPFPLDVTYTWINNFKKRYKGDENAS